MILIHDTYLHQHGVAFIGKSLLQYHQTPSNQREVPIHLAAALFLAALEMVVCCRIIYTGTTENQPSTPQHITRASTYVHAPCCIIEQK